MVLIQVNTIEMIPLIPRGSSTAPIGTEIHETDFGGKTDLHVGALRNVVEGLYRKLSNRLGQTFDAMHTDLFEFKDRELYYKGRKEPLTKNVHLRSVGSIAKRLGKTGIEKDGF